MVKAVRKTDRIVQIGMQRRSMPFIHRAKNLIDEGKKLDFVLAIGPIPMMKAVAEVTRPYGIKTVVSLNPVMVDGTGMCGGCRVIIDGVAKFACVDGPEFDAHLVDFKNLTDRNKMYQVHEQTSLDKNDENCLLEQKIQELD